MHLGAARELHPLAGALFDRGGEVRLGNDDIAAERKDLRFVAVRVDHRDLVGLAQRLDGWSDPTEWRYMPVGQLSKSCKLQDLGVDLMIGPPVETRRETQEQARPTLVLRLMRD
jgi:hypothetical protein